MLSAKKEAAAQPIFTFSHNMSIPQEYELLSFAGNSDRLRSRLYCKLCLQAG
ncbi:hypothetical protein [Anaerotignum sp.]